MIIKAQTKKRNFMPSPLAGCGLPAATFAASPQKQRPSCGCPVDTSRSEATTEVAGVQWTPREAKQRPRLRVASGDLCRRQKQRPRRQPRPGSRERQARMAARRARRVRFEPRRQGSVNASFSGSPRGATPTRIDCYAFKHSARSVDHRSTGRGRFTQKPITDRRYKLFTANDARRLGSNLTRQPCGLPPSPPSERAR